jgi:hypothetical protein
MKTINIKQLMTDSVNPTLAEISAALDKQKERHFVDTINWQEFSYKPEVSFSIAYGEKEIYLKYYVREKYFKAEKTESNQSVYEDSCVEFFISPHDDGLYYNMEFNGIGTCLMAVGSGRANRTPASGETISKIRRISSMGSEAVNEKEGDFSWTLTIAIPFVVFFRHNVENLKGKILRANFYKCGDKLKVPHYVTWNSIGTEKPDYHQPAYFGSLKFK